MTKGSLNLIEMHVEKFILGLAGAFLLYLGWGYLISSPNRTKFGNEELTPARLDEAIMESAKSLEDAVNRAQPEEVKKIDYSRQLQEQHASGIFLARKDGPPPPARELKTAIPFGKPIVVEGLQDDEENAGNVVVVRPLAPTQPVLRTGRSLVVKTPIKLGDAAVVAAPPAPKPADPKAAGGDAKAAAASTAVEQPWVSIAAYFPKKAQRDAMIEAKYAGYRAKVYVAGIEVQRRELQSNGEFSEWVDLEASPAMPELSIPEVVLDDNTGEVLGGEKIDAAFRLVKDNQNLLMEPPFYKVERGDAWEPPALPGHDDTEDDADDAAKPDKPVKKPPVKKEQPKPKPQGRFGGEGGGPGRFGGEGGAGGRFGGEGGFEPPENTAAQDKQSGQKAAKQDLADAEKSLKAKEFSTAIQRANAVISNEYANATQKRNAQKLIEEATKKQEAAQQSGGGTGARFGGEGGARFGGEGGGPGRFGGEGGYGRFGGEGGGYDDAPSALSLATAGDRRPPAQLLTNPETEDPAVWYHDDTVQSGKTYSYRMRVKLWNRYVGRLKAVASAEDAKKPVLVGEWSLPSEPVTVTPSTHFFVRGPKAGKPAANVDVWKWRDGSWVRQPFDVEVGDVIGGVKSLKLGETDKDAKEVKTDVDFTTGAVVLDLRFDQPVQQRIAGKGGSFSYREKPSLVMVYLDPADGQVKEKVQVFDQYDPVKKALEEQEDKP